MSLALAFAKSLVGNAAFIAAAFTSLVLFEIALPHGARPSPTWRGRLHALAIWAPYLTMQVALVTLIGRVFPHISPVLNSYFPSGLPRWLAVILGSVLAILTSDFFYYWCHRFEHRFLWRWHATHHSPTELSALADYHHPIETVMRAALYSLPLAFFAPDPFAIAILGPAMALHGHYLHSPMRFNYGPLWWVVMDNRMHRIHHSIYPEHYDKNFGVLTPIWDVLFGTAYFPKAGEWPETGVDGFPHPEGLGSYLFGPLRYSVPRAGQKESRAQATHP